MSRKNPWYNPKLAHHHPTRFSNIPDKAFPPFAALRWQFGRKIHNLPKPPAGGYAAFTRQWWRQTCFDEGQGDGIWWLGHACLLLRLNGRLLLTDPVFSQRVSPVPFAGPRRKTPLPCQLTDLPAPDAVLISHNHYDHLDRYTVKFLASRFAKVQFFVPLGLKRWFLRHGISQVTELDWWQSAPFAESKLQCVPAQHWSGRGLFDRNRTLWCGWLIESGQTRFWFSGDTGYSPQLLQIPQRLGKITAAAIPIGAYHPRWFMALHHMDPQQAVTLWQQLGCPQAIPIHWGVFELGDESLDMPVAELRAALAEQPENPANFQPLPIGGYLPLT